MRYLLDTNTVIDYLNVAFPNTAMQRLDIIIDNESIISVITKMETLGFNFKAIEELNVMEAFIGGSVILNIDNGIVDKTIEIRKIRKLKLPDAVIAATALVYSLTLLSRNLADFKNINGLTVIDPYSL